LAAVVFVPDVDSVCRPTVGGEFAPGSFFLFDARRRKRSAGSRAPGPRVTATAIIRRGEHARVLRDTRTRAGLALGGARPTTPQRVVRGGAPVRLRRARRLRVESPGRRRRSDVGVHAADHQQRNGHD